MRLSTLLSIYAYTAAGFCAGLIALPAFWIALYGAQPNPQSVVLLRLIGALFGGLAVVAWLARNAEPSTARDAIVIGLTVLNALAAAVAVSGALSGAFNHFAWGPVLTFSLFVAGFFFVRRTRMSAPAPRLP